jgi:GGDEF domain-containing protein
VLLATLARIRKITAPADLIGRYYGACFVVQISGKVSSQYLRGFGLRLATSTRRPVVPRLPPSGFEDDEPIETEVGIGMCWCDSLSDLTVALHEAEIAAKAARHMRSRAAVVLNPEEEPQAVEKVLGQAQTKLSFLDSATNRIRSMPSRMFSSAPRPSALKRAVRKVVRRSAVGIARPLAAIKPSTRGASRTVHSTRA